MKLVQCSSEERFKFEFVFQQSTQPFTEIRKPVVKSRNWKLIEKDDTIMFGKPSSAQPNVGLSGSGAMSHVYIQHPPLRCSIDGSRGLFYDDGNKLLLSLTSSQVFTWKTVPHVPLLAPNSDSIDEGPVLSIRYSLDAKIIGIQRSNHEIQFRNRETGETFIQWFKPESESILGFFWTDCPTCDIVFVKTSGLDLFSYESELKSLRLVETKRLNVSWYVYTHESRMVLLASGMQCKTLTGFQLSSGGVIRLPKFEMAMAKSEANEKPVLAAEDVHILTVYGRIYCLQVDRVAMLLHSYRFYRDAVVQQGSLPIYSSKIGVSVVDNVLLVHQVDAKVVILYDIFADSRAPISAPLPLLLRGLPRANASYSQSSSKDMDNMETNEMNDLEGTLYGDDWTFLISDLICDTAKGFLWRIHLDLEASLVDFYFVWFLKMSIKLSSFGLQAIAASSSDVPSVLEFIQRRKLEPYKAKQLCLTITRAVILERRPVYMVARAIDVLVTSYTHSVKTGSSIHGRAVEKTSTSGKHVDSSRAVADDTMSRVETHGKSVKNESSGGVESETRQARSEIVDNESFNPTTYSTMNRSSTCLASEENVNLESLKTNSGVFPGEPLSGDLRCLGAKEDSKKQMGAEISRAEGEPSSLQSQMPGPISEQQESRVASPAISPDEMYSFVFALVDEEMTGDPAYLVAIIVEYFRSAASERIKVHPNMYVLTVQLLSRSERYAELGLFIVNKILEPSKEVALQLLESGRQNVQTRKLGLDMLRQLSLHHDYVVLLVQDGYYLEALRYARKNKVNSVRPSLFLEAAFASNDTQHLAAVLRFFSDFIPDFKSTPDHSTYLRILNEMNSPIAA
ncbi:hypothetical protein HHK36_017465 [Tetracentron sinense]|uniref:Mic1 domain-containing protein n=1 Tax=Tetracentron sinense TaxID=13715 RepID=A0A834Z3A2_TETSI|nr:hypothetical protein HHK36_017465 [Tetracentron sinense]